MLVGAEKPVAAELGVGKVGYGHIIAAAAQEGGVVVDHHLLVLGKLQVELHAVAALLGQLEASQAVLRHAVGELVQAPMGVVKAGESRKVRLLVHLWGDKPAPAPEKRQYHRKTCYKPNHNTLLIPLPWRGASSQGGTAPRPQRCPGSSPEDTAPFCRSRPRPR